MDTSAGRHITVSTTTTFPLAPTWKTALRHIPFAFRVLAFIFLVIALAGRSEK
jgi:hypothetical protein